MEQKFWYYAEGDSSVGPLSLADLRAILSCVSGAGSVFVWRDGFTDWVMARNVPELVTHVVKPPPVPIVRRQTVESVPPPVTAGTPHLTESTEGGSANLHPWRRYFARMLDLYLFFMIFFVFLGIVFPELFQNTHTRGKSPLNDYGYLILGVGAYVIFEAICLNTVGITFGKFIYGIRIKSKEQDQIAFSIALKRSLAVWIRGLGFSVPIITLITLIVAYRTLTKEGQASWDRDFNCLILHRDYSALRWVAIAITWLVLFAIYATLIELSP